MLSEKFIELLFPGNFKEGNRSSINSLEHIFQVLCPKVSTSQTLVN